MKTAKIGKIEIKVRSLCCDRVLDKLAKEGIPVFSARKLTKNEISFAVFAKDSEKVFAILRGSCYNIVKTRSRGLNLLYRKCLKASGLLLGAAMFCLVVLGAQKRVLRIEVVGSGAFYEQTVLTLLKEGGVEKFSYPPADLSHVSASILSLPRVNYCSIAKRGGILTVEVRVGEETSALKSEPFLSPASGKVESIIVLRGTPLVKVGEEVKEGQTLVENYALYGEERREVVVIARAEISFPVFEVFEGDEEQAKSGAYLKYGRIDGLKAERSEGGFLISGTAFVKASVNLS